MGDNHLRSWLALHLIPGMGPVTCLKLVSHFGSPEKVLSASVPELKAVCRLRQESLIALQDGGWENIIKSAREEMERAADKRIKLLAIDDPLYPHLLKNIHDPPLVLYVLGDPQLLDRRGIGIVGSRAATHYGRNIAAHLAEGLAGLNFTVISGMALGIDTAAHKGSLAAGGKTIAVLGCGLDIIYPPSNHKLYRDISHSGAVVSEYPLGSLPEHFRFPARNRIISGLTFGVVVVEAASRSGSLITAKHALEQGREVFAVPGRIDSAKSAGTHALLQQGAKLVHSVNDIVEEFSHIMSLPHQADTCHDTEEEATAENMDHDEAVLFACLDVYPRTIDEIVRESGFTTQRTSELLLHLELKGVVASLPGNSFQRKSSIS